jgi:hypothetical protein
MVISVDHHHSTRSTGHAYTSAATANPHSRPTRAPSSTAATGLVNVATTTVANTPATAATPRNAIRAFRAYDCDTGASTTATGPV